jgi:soluble lytic murein transglycosylase-like protein
MKIANKLACMSIIMIGLSGISAHAQLASYRDENGKLVFINDDKPVKRPKTAKAESTTKASDAAQTAAVQTHGGPTQLLGSGITNEISAPLAPAELDKVVQDSAEKNHVDPGLVRAVISTESNWNPSAVSSKGAMGLMQLMPGTAQTLGVGNAFDPAQNIGAGTQYLGMMLERYNGDVNKALAAYNAGPGAVDRFGGVPNIPETRSYVQKVTSSYFRPGSNREFSVFGHAPSIYRTTDAKGRVIFVNE